MSVEPRRLVAKLWNYCDVLRDDGVSTIDYVEQLTFLLFLKMAHERANPALNPDLALQHVAARWQKLLDYDGDDLETEYRHSPEITVRPVATRALARGDDQWPRRPLYHLPHRTSVPNSWRCRTFPPVL